MAARDAQGAGSALEGGFGLYVVDAKDQPRLGQKVSLDGVMCEVVMVAGLPGGDIGFRVARSGGSPRPPRH